MALSAATAGAQTMYDGLTYSQNNYYGTARSIGMGNAMTAVGGDLGSVGINPAGSAVAGYSQFTITPNLTISAMNASYSAYPVGGVDKFTNETSKTLTRFSMPNFGLTFNWDTGSRSGLTSVTYGIIVNGTNNYTGQMLGGGQNDRTSYLSWMAVNAGDYDIDFLNGYRDAQGNTIDSWDNAYYNADDRGYYAPWTAIANAQAGAISNYGDVNDPDYYWRYIGATESFGYRKDEDGDYMEDERGNYIYDINLPGKLNQAYGRKVTGSKRDVIANLGLNFDQKFFLGFNLGITSLRRDYDEYFKEAAANPENFPVEFESGKTCFSDYRTRYSLTAEGSGVYGKVGFIFRPMDGVTIGAAAQSPTVLEITERYMHDVNVNYTNSTFNGSAQTPEGTYTYKLRTPYRLNAGMAFTFSGMALLSVDYEMTDYSKMKFISKDSWDETFDAVNDDIADCMGISHTVRVGAEFKPTPETAIRAGYNFTTTPEYVYNNGYYDSTLHDRLHAFSVGLGYSSTGSFFADLAARMTLLADEYISPYADYLTDVASPLILNKRNIFNITATFGWRF